MSLPPLLSEKDEGLRRAKIKYHENAYTEAFKNGYLLDDDMLKSDHIRQYSKNKNRHSHYMITINFPKTFTDYEIMEKVVRKKWMFRWEYTWEYHTEGENHPHVNMIIHKNKPPSEVQREIASTTKLNPLCVKVQSFPLSDYEKVYLYQFKDRASDVKWRLDNNLQQKYIYQDVDPFDSINLEKLEKEIQKNEKYLSQIVDNNA